MIIFIGHFFAMKLVICNEWSWPFLEINVEIRQFFIRPADYTKTRRGHYG